MKTEPVTREAFTLTTLTSIPARYRIGAAFFSNSLRAFLHDKFSSVQLKMVFMHSEKYMTSK